MSMAVALATSTFIQIVSDKFVEIIKNDKTSINSFRVNFIDAICDGYDLLLAVLVLRKILFFNFFLFKAYRCFLLRSR